jgi:hypothetical protein
MHKNILIDNIGQQKIITANSHQLSKLIDDSDNISQQCKLHTVTAVHYFILLCELKCPLARELV